MGRIALFYQKDDYGFDGLSGTQIALLRCHVEPAATGRWRRGSLEAAEALARGLPRKGGISCPLCGNPPIVPPRRSALD